MESRFDSPTGLPPTGSSTGSSAGPSPGCSEGLGFELDDEAWIAHLRASTSAPDLGRLGPYRLLEEIGRGGQGLVYRARQPGTGRYVAIKRLGAGIFSSPEMRTRFDREIEAAAALEHPGIVTVFSSEVLDGQPALLMQWVDGIPIDQWAAGVRAGRETDDVSIAQNDTSCMTRGMAVRTDTQIAVGSGPEGEPLAGASSARRSLREILELFLRVCEAIQHAHQRGIIHRDLKPTNILVDRADQPHVLDFGLAKIVAEGSSSAISLTRTGFMGTLAYAAPEQFRGRPDDVDTRTDVYALGAVLHQLLTGRAPLTDLGFLPQAIDGPSRHMHSLGDSGQEPPAELKSIVFKALSAEKDQRYASVDAMASDIGHFLANAPVAAYSKRVSYRARKFILKHRWACGLAGAAAGLMAILAVRSTTLAMRLSHEVTESTASARRERDQRVRAEELTRAARSFGEEAARQAAQNQAASEFLSGLLSSVPNKAGGAASEPSGAVLDLAAKQLDSGALHDQPDVEYRLRFQIGLAYERSRQLDSAAVQFEAAAATARRFYGTEHDKTADALSHLGAAHRNRNQLEESERTLREAIAISDRVHRGGAGSTWLGELAQTLRQRGNHAEAEHFFKRAAESWTRGRGLSDRRAAVAWQQLAREQAILGKWQEAESSARKSATAWEASGLTSDQSSSLCLRILGHARHMQRDFAGAVNCFEKALASEARTGKSSCSAQSCFYLAAAMLASGRDDEGRRNLLHAVSRCKAAEPGTPEFDALARRVESALRDNGFRLDSELRSQLGDDFKWLFSEDLIPLPATSRSAASVPVGVSPTTGD